ncbi:MAG: hypothetical protein HFI39_07550 [Lachnospiraceae bacterium]|nr:hypothetical protein [Lachnospiraceae bacterium]
MKPMKGKGIKPHVQPVRLEPPEPIKRFGARPAGKKAASGQEAGQENVSADKPETAAAIGKETTGHEQAE